MMFLPIRGVFRSLFSPRGNFFSKMIIYFAQAADSTTRDCLSVLKGTGWQAGDSTPA